jgi:uncharacterized protein YdiU (UPF0061 family)
MIPFLDPAPTRALALATEIVEAFPERIRSRMSEGLQAKLGLSNPSQASEVDDRILLDDWLGLLQANRVDFTLAWRRLVDAAEGNEASFFSLFGDREALSAWLGRWRERCAQDDAGLGGGPEELGRLRALRMRALNPIVVPRNHLVEEALAAASDTGDLQPFEALLEALRSPFDPVWETTRYASGASPEATARYRTFCGT